MKHVQLALATFALLAASAFGAVEVKSFSFETGKDQGKIVIAYDGKLREYPELKVSGSMIQVVIPDSRAKEMEKKVSFSTKGKDTSLSLANGGNNSSRLKAIFPFQMSGHKDKVALMIKNNKIELNFPRVAAAAQPAPAKAQAKTQPK